MSAIMQPISSRMDRPPRDWHADVKMFLFADVTGVEN
jgi:hypothetical protein